MPPSRPWLQRLQEPVDAASLAAFRFAFGIWLAIDTWRYLVLGFVREYYVTPAFHFTYFDHVQPLPGDGMILHAWVVSFLAVLVAFGLFYRVAAILLAVAYIYGFLLEKAAYMNHHYLMALVTCVLACLPAHRALSLDVRRGAVTPARIPRWHVGLVRFQLAIVYFYGAIAKINPDWLVGEPMRTTLERHAPNVPEIAYLLPPWLLAGAIAWAGVAIDFAVPVLLLRRRTMWWGLAIATVFHVLNGIYLPIGVFSWLMISVIPIFLAPDWPRRLPGIPAAVSTLPLPRRRWALALAGVYVVVQLLVPLRHWLYPGDVNWTEEGHRFSWRMKLRSKRSTLAIHATDPATGRTWTIDPAKDLIHRQQVKLKVFPDMLLQYVHWHRDRLREQGIDPEIRVDWQCSLNGAEPQPVVDPEVDLAKAERSWGPANWILPYQRRPRDRMAATR